MSLVPITDHRHDICNSHQRQASRGFSRVQRHILALPTLRILSFLVPPLQQISPVSRG